MIAITIPWVHALVLICISLHPAPPPRLQLPRPKKHFPKSCSITARLSSPTPSSGPRHRSAVPIDGYVFDRSTTAAVDAYVAANGITSAGRLINQARAVGHGEQSAPAVRILLTGHAAVVGALGVQHHGIIQGVGVAEVAAVVGIIAEQIVVSTSRVECGARREDCVCYGRDGSRGGGSGVDCRSYIDC